MKLEHRLKMLMGFGPKIIMAEPGTNPLDEPHLYVTRRGGGGGAWGMVLFWLLALAALGGGMWWYATR